MLINLRLAASIMVLTALGGPVSADVITDWNEKAVAFVTKQRLLPPQAERVIASVHLAMFDAVNSIERRYQPYLVQLSADPTTSRQGAAAAAAAMVLATIDEKTAGEMKTALAAYLALLPDSPAKSDGVKLGAAVAARVLEARANDGSNAPDVYRPRTAPGVYVGTTMTISSMWPRFSVG